jgi:WS/DGAT/MGAT family acyltransferase
MDAVRAIDAPPHTGGGMGTGLFSTALNRALTRRLSPQDSAFLRFDTDETPMNIGSVGIFEGRIDFDRFVDSVNSRLHTVPRYRQKIVPAPFNAGRPTWEFDPEFQITEHIHRLRIDPPGTDEQLISLAAQLYTGRLDRNKALWEIYLVEGLEEDRTGIFCKVHHTLVDGVSGIELLMVTLDLVPDPPPPGPPPPFEPPPVPDRLSLMLDAILGTASEQLDRWAAFQQDAADFVLGDPGHVRTIARALETAAPYLARPMARAPFNQPLSGERSLACTAVAFEEARAIRKACGGTVNDVVLAALGGAMGRYLQSHGEPTSGCTVRVATPVNVRREGDQGSLGNRISIVLVEVPVEKMDPVSRLHTVTQRTEQLKRERIADGLEALADAVLGLPEPFMAGIGLLRAPPNTVANMVCTNVPGPMIPLYTVGHPMLAIYPMAPLAWEMGAGCAVMSYNHRLYFSFLADTRAAPDVGRLRDFMVESFIELRQAADRSAGAGAGRAASTEPPVEPRRVTAA